MKNVKIKELLKFITCIFEKIYWTFLHKDNLVIIYN